MRATHKRDRTGAVLLAGATRITLALGLVGAIAAACSDPASPAGYKEYTAGTGGMGGVAGVAGKAPTMMVDGGDSMGGAADGGSSSGTGGRGGMGGGKTSGGAASGGKGGSGSGGSSGGPSTTCGNGTKDPGEECDDGNRDSFDGCSATCTSKCESCLHEFYGEVDEYKYMLELCYKSTEPAAMGPAAGSPRSQLCAELIQCIESSGCWKGYPDVLSDPCYCGAGVTSVDCDAGKAKGPCVEAYGRASESRDPAVIFARQTSTGMVAVGRAAILMNLKALKTGYCFAACNEDREATDCERCSVGDMPAVDDTANGCIKCFDESACSPALRACVVEKCADGNLKPCLGASATPDGEATSGPCKGPIAEAGTQFVPTAEALRCQATRCKAECFKP